MRKHALRDWGQPQTPLEETPFQTFPFLNAAPNDVRFVRTIPNLLGFRVGVPTWGTQATRFFAAKHLYSSGSPPRSDTHEHADTPSPP